MVIFSILFNIFYCLYCRKFSDEDKRRDIPNIFLYNWDDCSFFRFIVSTIADIRNSIAYYLCKRKKNYFYAYSFVLYFMGDRVWIILDSKTVDSNIYSSAGYYC